MTDTWHAKIHHQKILTLYQPEEVHHLDQVRPECANALATNASTIIDMLISFIRSPTYSQGAA